MSRSFSLNGGKEKQFNQAVNPILIKMDYPTTSRILAVDDSPDNLLLIETLLEDLEEYELSCVQSGEDALEAIASQPPDLILLDVMMPGMDGYEVTEKIRADETLPFIPILLLTANRQANVPAGLDGGADDFIRKPFKVEELMARMRALLRLKHSIDQQHQILRQRDDFVARLTHDLRTPLIAANRVLEFCNRGTYGSTVEEINPHLSSVIDSNDQLLNMVNTLLEVYRHEANRKELTFVEFNLEALLAQVVKQLSPLVKTKNVDFHLKTTTEKANNQPEFSVKGDRVEIIRAMTNIIGNAIKFTPKGSIIVSLEHCSHLNLDPRLGLAEADYILVKVADTGIGIKPKNLTTIFDWFRPGAHTNSGSGLGLHLSQRIIQRHQGLITAESEAGEGSIFTIYLPKVKTTS